MKKLEHGINRCTLNTTERCNLRCKYCFTYTTNSGLKDLDFNQGKKTIDWLFKDEISQSDEIQLDFWGGEPLLKFELIKRLSEYAVQKASREGKRIMLGGTTNATLVTKEVVDWMNQSKAYMMLSIDGIKEVQDKYRPTRMNSSSWDEIERNLPYIVEKIPFIRSRSAPTPETIGRMFSSMKEIREKWKITTQMFSPVFEMDWTDNDFKVAEEQMKMLADYIVEVRKKGEKFEVKHFDDGASHLEMKKSRREAPCLSGDTKISLLNGMEVEIKDLVDKENFWVYSCNEQKEIVPGLAKKVWKTGTKEVVKVTLDNGETFRCTPDHLLMLRDGTYLKAKECLDKSMMPLYKDFWGFYEKVKSNKTEKYELTYKLVDKFFNGEFFNNDHTHHIDFNKNNNSPENLKRMTKKEHYDLHASFSGAGFVDKWKSKDEEFIKNHSRRSSKQMTELNKRMWKDPVHRERLLKQVKRNGEKVGFSWASKEQLSEMGKKGGKKAGETFWKNLDPEFLERFSKEHSILAKEGKIGWGEHWKDEKFKEKMKKVNSETGKKNIHYLVEYSKSEEGRKKSSEVGKRYGRIALSNYSKSEEGKKQTGINSKIYWQWKKSNKTIEWNDFFKQKRQEYNHKIISIEYIGIEDVYDIEVETHHNFAISSGIFVHNCGAGKFYVGISTSGEIFPCHRFEKFGLANKEKNKKVIIGTIDDGITNPEFRNQFIKFLDYPVSEKCKNCKWLGNLCDISCFAVNHDLTGDIKTPPEKFCKWQEVLGNSIVYFHKKLKENNIPIIGMGQNLEGRTQMKGACVCNNSCYLEGTEHEIKVVDWENQFGCHCYNTNYSGGLSDQCRILTEEEMLEIKPKSSSMRVSKEGGELLQNLNERLDKMDTTNKNLTDAISSLTELLKSKL